MLKLSVVIPTINRASLLARTIDHIQSQTVPREHYEVIVVDNHSSDDTHNVLEQKTGTYSSLRSFHQTKPGAAATRNVGIRMARGPMILFIDDDILAEPFLIQRHLDYHEENPRSSIIGAISTRWADTGDPFLRYLRDRGIFNPYSLAGGPLDFSYYHTGNVSTPRSLLEEAGGFNEEFCVYGMEDIDLGYRLEKAGCRMVYGANARAVHHYFPSYDQFLERCQQAGYSLGRLLALHPELKPRFVENGRATPILKKFHWLYRFLYPALVPASTLLTFWERHRGTGRVTPILDLHYYWAVRYHIFLGYHQYIQKMSGSRLRIAEPAVEAKVESDPVLPS